MLCLGLKRFGLAGDLNDFRPVIGLNNPPDSIHTQLLYLEAARSPKFTRTALWKFGAKRGHCVSTMLAGESAFTGTQFAPSQDGRRLSILD
jgi:hypothetical protein